MEHVDVWCSCGVYMGEIVVGSKLRKEYTVICKSCKSKLEHYSTLKTSYDLLKTSHTTKQKNDNPFGDIFGDIFNKRK